ncbi:Glyoxylase, beta-lactamase superfamily II [Saccharicrinis carchari]|uniref:Glyoxylase, beta-lactamase superfamily II n=1 Tax=Saccharicrinis carchari TaxID=1168039 RepID=A0A521DB26_SACCC|nr:MBL fold metallo-hydrolase [Saccharicrinis carchari]SMO68934.1 Glyoxylase, beta-lactamase superfamily II [Saccharicrinis carchari]
MLKVITIPFNPWQENTYIIAAENGECIIVDPGCLSPEEQEHLVTFLDDNKLTPVRLLNTHLHLDHVFGNHFVCEKYNLGAEAHKDDEFWLDQMVAYAAQMGVQIEQNPPALKGYLEHGQVIEFAGSTIQVRHIPGHSPGGVVFYMEKEKAVIAGDVIFRESVGRSDLPGGDFDTLISGIKTHLFTLPDETVVYSGHGPSSTIGHEKANNPFFY